MNNKTILAAVALLALAACNSSANNSTVAASAPVAAVAPPAGTEWTTTVAATPDGGYRMGNPNAPIKLVEYGSRTCPVCGQFGREAMTPIAEKYVATGKVSFEFREFLVHGQPDVPAALLGRCGGGAPFFGILEAMYREQDPVEAKMNSPEGRALFEKMAGQPPHVIATSWAELLGYIPFVQQRGITEAQARACLADEKELNRITDGMKIASEKLGVSGTPTFFINGAIVEGASTWGALEPQLRAAGA